MKSSKLVTTIVLLVPIGLVAGPVLWAGMRSEVAHWYLAAAANAIELGKGDADKALESARAWDPEVGKLQDFWSVRLRQLKSQGDVSMLEVLKEVPEERKQEIAERLARQYGIKGDFALAAEVMRVLLGERAEGNVIYWDIMVSQALEEEGGAKAIQVLQEAIAANPENAPLRIILARQFALILSDRDEFGPALEAYKLWFGEKHDRDVTTLNALAYGRALANVELDQALNDINEALSYQPDDPDLRDTRAWVYYQLGRYDEAFADADFSVKAKESPSLKGWVQRLSEWVQTEAAASSSISPSAEEAAEKQPSTEVVAEPPPSEGEPPIVMLDPPKSYLTPRNTSITTWSLGVVRYHRAKILEKLGRIEEAEVDWKWIEENHLPPDERLH